MYHYQTHKDKSGAFKEQFLFYKLTYQMHHSSPDSRKSVTRIHNLALVLTCKGLYFEINNKKKNHIIRFNLLSNVSLFSGLSYNWKDESSNIMSYSSAFVKLLIT